LVSNAPSDRMEVVLQEILQDKIFLDTSNEVRITGEMPISIDEPDFDD
jgi:hypothetical protein